MKSTVSTASTVAGSAAATRAASVLLPTPGSPANTARTIVRPRSGGKVRQDLSGGLVAVRVGQALHEVVGLDLVLLRTDGLQHQRRHQRTDLGRPLGTDAPVQRGEETGPEAVADAGRVVGDHVADHRHMNPLDT